MISYAECEKAVSSFPTYPEKEYVWFAYKNGECQTFASRKEALTFSENVERSEANKEQYEALLKIYYDDLQKVVDYWFSELRKEFNVPDNIFDICYAEAYERGHACGYDEVYNYMIDIVSFAKRIMTECQNKI